MIRLPLDSYEFQGIKTTREFPRTPIQRTVPRRLQIAFGLVVLTVILTGVGLTILSQSDHLNTTETVIPAPKYRGGSSGQGAALIQENLRQMRKSTPSQ